jgi:hypothetical protein
MNIGGYLGHDHGGTRGHDDGGSVQTLEQRAKARQGLAAIRSGLLGRAELLQQVKTSTGSMPG